MLEELNFTAPQEEFQPAVVTKEIAESYKFQPMPNTLLVLKPEVSKTTKSGLQKADSQIADELKKMDHPFTVLAVGRGVAEDGVLPGAAVVVQRFTATNLPSPLEGFDVVLVRSHDVLVYDKTIVAL